LEKVISVPGVETMKHTVVNHYSDELDRLHTRYYGDRFSDLVYQSSIREMEEAIAELLALDETDGLGISRLELKYRSVINELADSARL
jgi:hypothetical protein